MLKRISQEVKVSRLIPTKTKQITLYRAADSIRGLALMPLCPSLGTPVARAEVDTAVAWSLVPCGEAMEQKGQRSPAFRLKERTGESNSLLRFTNRLFEVIRFRNEDSS